MSETMTAGDLGLAQEDFDRMPEGVRETLRKSKKLEREAAERDVREASLAREVALLRAGIPDSPIGKMFAAGYQGDSTPEAIKTAWEELGVADGGTGSPAATAEDAARAEELEAQRRLAGVGAGAGTGNDGAIPLEDAINSAKSEDEVMRLVGAAPPEAKIVPPLIQ
jgi:hypothetical protein